MPVPPLQHILVGFDGSRHSKAACRYAAGLAAPFGARLTILRVDPPFVPPSIFTWEQETTQQAVEKSRHYDELMSDVEEAIGSTDGVEVELDFGLAADVIRQRAKDLNVDLIIVGSRGLGAIGALFLGSVSGEVVRDAHCSVLVVRDTDEDQPAT